MPKQIADGKKIVKNTVALYCRMILTMIIGLYTSRIVLQTLGVVDFGIYSVVGSVVVMFSFLNGTMAATTQRYLSFFLGVGDFNKVNKVFNATLAIHMIICAFVILIAETFGLWFLNHRMNIPSDRISVANFVYQMSVIAAVFSITQVPYTAVITAREKMDVYDEDNGIFSYVLDSDIDFDKIIFNNGEGTQTADLDIPAETSIYAVGASDRWEKFTGEKAVKVN